MELHEYITAMKNDRNAFWRMSTGDTQNAHDALMWLVRDGVVSEPQLNGRCLCKANKTEPACSALDEAIAHAHKVADSYAETEPHCKCACEHRQLANWLEELKLRRAQEAQKGEM